MKSELKKKINNLPLCPGVYIYKNKEDKVIYVGKSIKLRDRVRSYFMPVHNLGSKTARLVAEIVDLNHIETESELEALILEADLIKKYRPQFNTQWKDDKGYKYIEICNARLRKRIGVPKATQQNIWPWVTTTRRKDNKNSLYFGPFPEGRTVNQVLKILRRIFPWCQYASAEVAKRQKKPCFYSHIRLCPGICSEKLDLAEYWKINDNLVLFFKGKKKLIIQNAEKEMRLASKNLDFERAAYYRDIINKLTYITQSFRESHEYLENPNLKQDIRDQEIRELINILNNQPARVLPRFSPRNDSHPFAFWGSPEASHPLNQDTSENYEQKMDFSDFRIEGYDISNLGKKFTVASRVVFIGGEPSKSNYRRYKIQEEKLPNDFAAMEEVLTRRLKKQDDLPDLLLIDGGKGQLSVALKVLGKMKLQVPAIGLAKKFETIFLPYPGGFKEVSVPKNSPALKLLMRIRDESHRFAQKYHKLLRKKSLVSN